MEMLITAYPYAIQYGTINVPDDIINPEEYIREHWDDIAFDNPEITYYGKEFDYEKNDSFWKDGNEEIIDAKEINVSSEYLGGMYNLYPIDYIKLNKEKLAEIYNCSDIDALTYMHDFCTGELKELCERLIDINMNTDVGWGREPATNEEIEEYYDGKWKLLTHFGIGNDCGDAYAIKETESAV